MGVETTDVRNRPANLAGRCDRVKRLWWLTGPALALVAMLGIWLGPYVLSVYHTEAGGRALDAALVPVFPDRLAPEQVRDAKALEAGIAHLHEASRRDPRNVQALRLLARAYLSQGNPQAALAVLQQALTVRPENPLLHLELGDVYDALGQSWLCAFTATWCRLTWTRWTA